MQENFKSKGLCLQNVVSGTTDKLKMLNCFKSIYFIGNQTQVDKNTDTDNLKAAAPIIDQADNLSTPRLVSRCIFVKKKKKKISVELKNSFDPIRHRTSSVLVL